MRKLIYLLVLSVIFAFATVQANDITPSQEAKLQRLVKEIPSDQIEAEIRKTVLAMSDKPSPFLKRKFDLLHKELFDRAEKVAFAGSQK